MLEEDLGGETVGDGEEGRRVREGEVGKGMKVKENEKKSSLKEVSHRGLSKKSQRSLREISTNEGDGCGWGGGDIFGFNNLMR